VILAKGKVGGVWSARNPEG